MSVELHLGDMNSVWKMAEEMKGYGFGITYDNDQWVSSFLLDCEWECFYSSDAGHSIYLAYQIWKDIQK